ncbi:MAG: hypothetical protein ACPL4N_01390, partial [Candidatus Norongarragalinales archaeon]
KAEPLAEHKVVFELPQFKTRIEGRIEGDKIVFDKPLSEKEASDSKFVRAVAETFLKYARSKRKHFKGFKLSTVSDAAFGSGGAKAGLGSSAAVTVAATAALMHAAGFKLDENLDLVHKIAQFVHSKAQGKVGSGFDITAATFGGCAYSRYSPSIINNVPENAPTEQIIKTLEGEWDYSTKKVELPPKWVSVIAFTGKSASTSEMVKKINEFKASKPLEYAELMKQINEANKKAIDALEKIGEIARKSPEKYGLALKAASKNFAGKAGEGIEAELATFKEFQKAFDEGRLLTKKLGELSGAPIETQEFTDAIETAKKKGAFVAKLPGAGGGDSIAALCLSKGNARKVAEAWTQKGYKILDLRISNEGVRRESPKKFEAKLAEAA